MKVISFLVIALLVVSCTVAKHKTAGTYASLGGKTKNLVMDSEGISMTSNDNSTAFAKAMDEIKAMWSNYLLAKGLEYLGGKYYSHQGKVVDSNTSLSLEKIRTAKDLELAKIELRKLEMAQDVL